MRVKDESKLKAICDATVSLVNEIGFAAASVAKIAKKAEVSPATIYIYFENKEDLLVSTYVDIKKDMSEVILQDFNDQLPIRDILQNIWHRVFDYIMQNPDKFKFTEQFSNSPFADLVNKEEVNEFFAPVYVVLQQGVDQKIIKNVSFDILSAFIFFPIFTLANDRLCAAFTRTSSDIDQAFTLAWDAIKL